MKRDMELIRKIMLRIEEDDSCPTIEGYEDQIVFKHLELLEEAGLVKANFVRAVQGEICGACVERLTWGGHEFLDAARNESAWRRAREVIGDKAGSVPFAILQSLLLQLAKSALGLP